MNRKFNILGKTRLFILTACFCLFANISSACFAEKIGVVDNFKVMSQYSRALEAKRKIESLRGEFQDKITVIREQFDKDIKTATKEEEKTKIAQNAQAKMEGEKARYDSMIQAITSDIDEKVESAVSQVAKEKALDVVLSNSVVYFGGQDITQDVSNKLK